MALPASLETYRLCLRPIRPEDAGGIAAIMRDPLLPDVMTRVPETGIEKTAKAFAKDASGRTGHWMICREGAAIGWVSLDPVLSIVLASDARGMGYGDEAAYAVLAAGADAGLTQFRAGHHPKSDASRQMLARLGMTGDGFLEVTRSGGRKAVFRRVSIAAKHFNASRRTVITTDRLQLAPLTLSDAAEISRIVSNPNIARMLGSVTCPQPEAVTATRIANRRFFDRPGFALGIRRSGKVIGEIGLGPDPVSFYYWLGEAHWGKGIATEACHAFLAHMLPRLGLSEITADCFTDNPSSAHVLQKLGFQETGTGMGTSRARDGSHPIRDFRLTLDAFNAKRAA